MSWFTHRVDLAELAGHDAWKTTDPADADPFLNADAIAAEERKAHDWQALEAEAREFVQQYGAAAMLRCVSEALK